MNQIIIGTQNPHKKEKLSWIVKDCFAATPISNKIEIEEDGDTFEENAKIKASFVAKQYKKYAIASDGGALIPSLGYNWNALLTRRFIGKNDANDRDRIEALLLLMKNKNGDERKVVWREAIAVANPEGEIIFSVEVEGDTGLIQEHYDPSQYREGIWLCTLTSYPQFGGKNFFELSSQEIKEGEISWWRLKEAFEHHFKLSD